MTVNKVNIETNTITETINNVISYTPYMICIQAGKGRMTTFVDDGEIFVEGGENNGNN